MRVPVPPNPSRTQNIAQVGNSVVKASTITKGYLALFFVILFNVIIFLITLLRSKSMPWLMAIIFFIFCTAFIPISINYFRQSIKARKESLKSTHTDTFSDIGTAFKFIDFLKIIGIVLFALLFFGIFVFVMLKTVILKQGASIGFTAQTWVYLAFLGVSLLISLFYRKRAGSMKKIGRLPFYALKADGVVIDLNYLTVGSDKKYSFKVSFNEIDEIKSLSFIEAENYQKYTIGPNVPLVAEKVKQEIQFLQGKIPRPEVYFMDAASNGINLLMRGPRVFYMLPVSNENIDELLDAYRDYKIRKAKNSKKK